MCPEPFWNETATTLVARLCLHVASDPDLAPEDRNLVTVRRLILEGNRAEAEFAALNMGPKDLKKYGPPSGWTMLLRAMKRNLAYGGVDAGRLRLGR